MGLIKGSLNLTRYRVTSSALDADIAAQLLRNAFVDIEHSPEESSLGWVEAFDYLKSEFDPAAWNFSGFFTFALRHDSRKVKGKDLARYLAIREAAHMAKTGRGPTSLARKEMREAIKAELLRKALVETEVMEVIWFQRESEVWLGAAGEKRRELFEELWGRSFGLSLQMLVPVTQGLEIMPPNFRQPILDSKPTPCVIPGDSHEYRA